MATKIEWLENALRAGGRQLGAVKTAAKRIGVPLSEYENRVRSGLKYCTTCKRWHERSAFGVDATRYDGLDPHCLKSRHTGRPRGWSARPKINPLTGRPGPVPKPRRDGDKKQARARVNVLVRRGELPRPNDVPCVDCGHEWSPGERRHEYDHHRGYAAEHHLDVEAVCSTCHHRREKGRSGAN